MGDKISPERGATAERHEDVKPSDKNDISTVEKVFSNDELQKDHADYGRIDPEVAEYATATAIEISPEENKRLFNLINKRVLPIMVFTYFIQALDKGTLSFTSIMGIRTDLHLVAQEYNWLTTCIYIAVLIVEYPTNW